MATRIIPVDPFDLAIFGATGDLARRKIFPSLLRRHVAGQIPDSSKIVGIARSGMTVARFRDLVADALAEHAAEIAVKSRKGFLALIDFVQADAHAPSGWEVLADGLRPEDEAVRAFYLSVAPHLFGPITDRLRENGMITARSRIVVEKPFGEDEGSARALNAELLRSFEERQIYRIDHYLGKETVQNLMALRFANILFESLWNSSHIDHVQITVAESLGVAGRGEYYDQAGAIRDMIQNHLMQLLCLIAMEPPARFEPDAVRDEKLKVIRALRPVTAENIVRGQYRAGGDTPSFADDVGNPNSTTESFLALKVEIANWRWSGVPFYLRTGKRLRARSSEIAVVFRTPPHNIFPGMAECRANALIIRLQPDEGINLHTTIKDPGLGGMRLTEVSLDMSFADALGETGRKIPDAYERLIMDVIRGDQTLFMRGDEVETAWAWIDPVIAGWRERGDRAHPYDPGGSGPEEALELLHRSGRRWREIDA